MNKPEYIDEDVEPKVRPEFVDDPQCAIYRRGLGGTSQPLNLLINAISTEHFPFAVQQFTVAKPRLCLPCWVTLGEALTQRLFLHVIVALA